LRVWPGNELCHLSPLLVQWSGPVAHHSHVTMAKSLQERNTCWCIAPRGIYSLLAGEPPRLDVQARWQRLYHHSPGSAMQAHACSSSRRCWEGVPLRVAAGRFAVGSLPNPISSALARCRHGRSGRASRQTLSRWQTYRGCIGMMVLGQR
jgi:hypothetical protein